MQGKFPCHKCPYGELCEKCPELIQIQKDAVKGKLEKGGFYSHEIVQVTDPNGKKKYAYSHPE